MKTGFLFLFLLCGGFLCGHSQTGISVSPPRAYFEIGPGQTGTEKISVTNASKTTVLDLALSLADWGYDEKGNNVILPADSLKTSFAKWIVIREGSYFSLKPGETRDLTINVVVPPVLPEDISTFTALLFVSQMNPVDDVNAQGSSIKVSVRSGIKLYLRSTVKPRDNKLEITGLKFDSQAGHLQLEFHNMSNVWTDGVVYTDLLNTGTGKTVKIEEAGFRTLPGDRRVMFIPLPGGLTRGNYTATVMIDYGNNSEMEAAELKFTYE